MTISGSAHSPALSNEWLEVLFHSEQSRFVLKCKSKLLRSCEVPAYFLGTVWKRIAFRGDPLVSEATYSALLLSPHSEFKFESEIRRDTNRTFPNLKFFQETGSLGQTQLYNVLRAYASYNPEVGYCQGMGFVAGLLLCHMSELDAFNILTEMMRKDGVYNMQALYKPGLPLVNKYLSELDGMIESEIPTLADHFLTLGIETSMFASQWILTLLIYNLESRQCKLLFSMFLLFGMKVVLLFSIFVLSRVEAELLTLGFEDCLSRINNMQGVTVKDFVRWLDERGIKVRLLTAADAGRDSGDSVEYEEDHCDYSPNLE